MKPFALAVSLLSLVLNTFAQPGESSQGGGVILGHVSRVAMIEPVLVAPPDGVVVQTAQQDPSRVAVRLASTGETTLFLRLRLRANARYELTAALFPRADSLGLAASIDALNATGSSVSPGAIEGATRSEGPVQLTPRGALLLEGPRVSAGGSGSSPSNALDVSIKLRVEQTGHWQAALFFTVRPVR
jgi:hypothetical protein